MKPRKAPSLPARTFALRIPRRALAGLMGAGVLIVAAPPANAGIIAALLTGALHKASASAKTTQARSDLMSLSMCLDMYELDAGVYPSTEQGLKVLIEKPAVEPIPGKWARIMDKMPVDPWGHAYQYRYPGTKDPAKYELFSLGKDGAQGTADDIRKDE